jgi:hypothetical protein
MLIKTSEMKYIIYGVWANFATYLANDQELRHVDAYTAPPAGHRLDIKLEKLSYHANS